MMVVKSRFYQSLAKHGVPHPRTTLASEASGVDDSEIQFPVFLRPVESLPFFEQFGVKGFIAQDRHALTRHVQRTASYHLPLLVQEIIPGPARQGYILRGYVDQHARPLALLVTQKLRQPSMFATNTGVLSIPLAEFKEGISLLLRYFRTIGYHGLFGAEFKRDPRDGVLKLLEINARSQGGNNVGVVCGVNHILAAYRDRLDQPPLPITAYRSGIYYGAVFLDVWSVLQMALQGELHGHDIRDYLRPTYWNYLDRVDPAPFVHHLWRLGSGLWSRISHAH
jgi:predicted ATP-grasp superfamily ATP-dependent carboligase